MVVVTACLVLGVCQMQRDICVCVCMCLFQREKRRESLGLGSLLTLPLLTAVYEQHFNNVTLLTI